MSEPPIGREHELAALRHAVRAAQRGRGGALMLRGAAGIGKTRLLDAICDVADGPVLRTAGGVLERDHPYGALTELIEPLLIGPAADDELRAAAGPGLVALASGAGPAFSLLPPADAQMSLEHGFRRVIAAIGRRSPGALVVVDDVHWLDDASIRAVAHATRGIEATGVLLVCAARPDTPSGPAPRALMQRTRVLDVGPLDLADVGEIAARSLGVTGDEELAAALHRQTSGNPLLLSLLVEDLRRRAAAVTSAAVLAARPPDVARAVALRLGEVGTAATDVAQAVAVLGGEAALLRRAATLAKLPLEKAASCVANLTEADMLLSGEPLRFAHPLVAAATLDQMPEAARGRAYLDAARVLEADGARPAVVAARLLAATPSGSPWAIAALRTAGEEALAQGDPGGAGRLLRRALEEGPPADVREAIAAPLARAAAFANDDDAAERMEAALAAAPGAMSKVMALLDRGDALVASGRPAESRAVLERALRLAGDPEVVPELRAYAVVAAETAAWVHGQPYSASPQVTGNADDSQTLGARSLADAARLALTGAGTSDEIVSAAVDGLNALSGMARLGGGFLATMAFGATDRSDELTEILAEGAAWADEVGSPLARGSWEAARGILAGWLGDLDGAAQRCERAIALEAEGWDRHAPAVRATLIEAEIDRGNPASARALAVNAGRWQGRFDEPAMQLAMARLQPSAEAEHTLRRAGQAAEAIGVRSPMLLPWRAALALVLAARAPDEAAELAERHRQLADHLGTPRARGVALRVMGSVHRDVELLRAATELLAASPARLEHARAELTLGEVLRRAGHRVDAREHLRQALLLAETCGASAVARRARDELVAAGGRDRRGAGDALTPAERRVARLAAAGSTNPEIAEELFLGRRTVEMHLSRTYRKLGIAGRAQLAGRLDQL